MKTLSIFDKLTIVCALSFAIGTIVARALTNNNPFSLPSVMSSFYAGTTFPAFLALIAHPVRPDLYASVEGIQAIIALVAAGFVGSWVCIYAAFGMEITLPHQNKNFSIREVRSNLILLVSRRSSVQIVVGTIVSASFGALFVYLWMR
jgi:hypothetical protein